MTTSRKPLSYRPDPVFDHSAFLAHREPPLADRILNEHDALAASQPPIRLEATEAIIHHLVSADAATDAEAAAWLALYLAEPAAPTDVNQAACTPPPATLRPH